jgi:hypothetical protein
MLRIRTALRALAGVAMTAALFAVAAPAAEASSIVYIKGGNVWLSSPDAAAQYQVTFDGGYDQPSQASDGTIVAVRGGKFVRIDRSGRPLNPPVDWFGNEPPPAGSKADQFFGPYHARVSPDGTRIAYAFKQREYDCDPMTNVCDYQIVEYTTTSAADRFTPASPATSVSRDGDPSWIDNTRLLVADPFDPQQINTWVAGHGDDGEQWWFGGTHDQNGFGDPEREPALSPDQSKLVDVAAVGGQFSAYDRVYFYTTSGPAWAGDPPYDNNGSTGPKPNAPSLSCIAATGPVDDPVWSPDSREVAFQLGDGIHVASVPGDISQPDECSAITDRLIAPAGAQPSWGPADVNRAQAPGQPKGGGGGGTPRGAAACTVPRLVHLTLAQVGRVLARAHCQLGRIRRPRHVPRRHVLRVVRQSARAGSTHPANYPVDITTK